MATLVEEQSFSGLIVEVKADDQGMTPQALKIQIFDENKEKRVDSPPPNMKEVSKAFELNCLAVPGQELREITNICKQESLKLSLNSDNKNSNCQTEKRGSNENYSISPTGKGTILSASRYGPKR